MYRNVWEYHRLGEYRLGNLHFKDVIMSCRHIFFVKNIIIRSVNLQDNISLFDFGSLSAGLHIHNTYTLF